MNAPNQEDDCYVGDEDGSSVVSHSSNHTSAVGENQDVDPASAKNNDAENQRLAQKESQAVFRLKLVLLGLLAVAMVGVSVAVYAYVSNAEQSSFATAFHGDSTKMLEAFGSTLDQTLGAVDSFVTTLTSFAEATASEWPYVTLPHYGVRTSKIRSLSKAVALGQYHIVWPEQRETWENYSVANDGWVDEVLETQRHDPTFAGLNMPSYQISPVLFNNTQLPVPPNQELYLAYWQSAPMVPYFPPYNWDAYSSDYTLMPFLDEVLHQRRVVLSHVNNLLDRNNPYSEAAVEAANAWISGYVAPGDNAEEPWSNIYYPILDGAANQVEWNVTTNDSNDSNNSTVVAIFTVTFYWRDMIKDILPPGSDGMVAVFHNGDQCNQTFTYQVNGPDTVYLGPGDLHNPKYSEEQQSSTLNDLDTYSTRNSAYTGLPLTHSACPWVVTLYPSDTMEERFISNDPIIFAVMAMLIFAVTSLVFLVYDVYVERRQKKVLKTAVQSTAIVTSLFPNNVHDRLFHQDETKKEQKETIPTSTTTPEHNNTDNNQIADLYDNATILFADLAGFTAWSSNRTPAHVFELLETLYGAFDTIAKQRRVFKVETIGDCYLAVTGVPKPQKEHAVIMSKFASECMTAMGQLIHDELVHRLGEDVVNLQFRVGLHSGPVTAGVIRGDRPRFQLFGDTVNTASRMESNSMPGRIQASLSTAELLIQAGKKAWVEEREGGIEAKGKGRLRTFWITPMSTKSSMARSILSVPQEEEAIQTVPDQIDVEGQFAE